MAPAAYRRWLQMEEPDWAMVDYPKIDFQDQYYYARPKSMAEKPKSLDEVDPKLLETYEKLGIPLKEQMILAGVEGAEEAPAEGRKVAVDAVFDSVSVGTTFQAELAKAGVIFCSISEAIRSIPELVKKYLGSVVPVGQLLRDAELGGLLGRLLRLRAAGRALPDGAVDLFPHQRREHRPVRTHADHRRQGLLRLYLEGCTAPQRDTTSCTPRWWRSSRSTMPRSSIPPCRTGIPGDENGKGGIYNFVTKRADCRGDRSKVMWTQVETGSAVTWKYPSCILRGDDSQGEFYSIAITNNASRPIPAPRWCIWARTRNRGSCPRGSARARRRTPIAGSCRCTPRRRTGRNYTQCDSLLIGDKCGAHTVPYIEVKNNSSRVEHEATTSKVDDDQLFYCRQRGMDEEEAVALIVNGFCKEVLQALPMEFAMEAQQLVGDLA
jgi:Fe-S cluster assembly protein SufB